MTRSYMRVFGLLPVLFLALFLTACDSGGGDSEPEPEPTPTPTPTFTVSSVEVPLVDNTTGIQFFVEPNMDVVLVRVDIDPPAPLDNINVNANSTTIIAGERFDLQDTATEAYPRVSGTWRFRFIGRLAAGAQTSFDFTQNVTVGA